MNDKTKKVIVVLLNVLFTAILGLAPIYGWELGWYGAVTLIIAVVLDTWAAIEWIPPKRLSQ